MSAPKDGIGAVQTAMEKRKGKKGDKSPQDLVSKFRGVGVVFKGKFYGTAEVKEARGDEMCQKALTALKSAVKSTGEHKQRINIRINLAGMTLLDATSNVTLHEHAVNRISFISKDQSDSRSFAYVIGCGDGQHLLFGIKTDKSADSVVLSLRDLFQAVYQLKTQRRSRTESKVSTQSDLSNASSQQETELNISARGSADLNISGGSTSPVVPHLDTEKIDNRTQSSLAVDTPMPAASNILGENSSPVTPPTSRSEVSENVPSSAETVSLNNEVTVATATKSNTATIKGVNIEEAPVTQIDVFVEAGAEQPSLAVPESTSPAELITQITRDRVCTDLPTCVGDKPAQGDTLAHGNLANQGDSRTITDSDSASLKVTPGDKLTVSTQQESSLAGGEAEKTSNTVDPLEQSPDKMESPTLSIHSRSSHHSSEPAPGPHTADPWKSTTTADPVMNTANPWAAAAVSSGKPWAGSDTFTSDPWPAVTVTENTDPWASANPFAGGEQWATDFSPSKSQEDPFTNSAPWSQNNQSEVPTDEFAAFDTNESKHDADLFDQSDPWGVHSTDLSDSPITKIEPVFGDEEEDPFNMRLNVVIKTDSSIAASPSSAPTKDDKPPMPNIPNMTVEADRLVVNDPDPTSRADLSSSPFDNDPFFMSSLDSKERKNSTDVDSKPFGVYCNSQMIDPISRADVGKEEAQSTDSNPLFSEEVTNSFLGNPGKPISDPFSEPEKIDELLNSESYISKNITTEPEKGYIEPTSTEQTPTELASTEPTSTEPTSTERTPAGQTSTEQTSIEPTSTDQTFADPFSEVSSLNLTLITQSFSETATAEWSPDLPDQPGESLSEVPVADPVIDPLPRDVSEEFTAAPPSCPPPSLPESAKMTLASPKGPPPKIVERKMVKNPPRGPPPALPARNRNSSSPQSPAAPPCRSSNESSEPPAMAPPSLPPPTLPVSAIEGPPPPPTAPRPTHRKSIGTPPVIKPRSHSVSLTQPPLASGS